MKVIIDTDCDMDDMMAILYLLKKKEVEVMAITTTGTGMAHWDYTAPNILKLLQLASHPDIPVAYGAKEPLTPYASFPEDWRKKVDEVYNIHLPQNSHSPSSLSSWKLMNKMIKESEEKVTVLCLGPLTNVALALEDDPSITSNIDSFVISGGALNVKGNIVGKPHGALNDCAEYNIFLDAGAAEKVFVSGADITLVPLDATEDAPITHHIYERFKQEKRNPSSNFVFDIIQPFVKSQKNTSVYFWDPAAASVMTTPCLGQFKKMALKVNQEPGPKYGCLIQDDKAHPISICTSLDTKEFENLFFNTLSQED